jgi:uncharacterized RDD family membrane protein YckC
VPLPFAPVAPVGRRVAARLLDTVLLGWITIFVVVEIGARLLGGDPLGRRAVDVDLSAFRTIVLMAVCVVVVEILPVVLVGRTLGKAMTGVTLQNVDGERPGWAAMVLRSLLLYGPAIALPVLTVPVLLVLLASIVLSAERRGLHDRLAGTRVVLAPERP